MNGIRTAWLLTAASLAYSDAFSHSANETAIIYKNSFEPELTYKEQFTYVI